MPVFQKGDKSVGIQKTCTVNTGFYADFYFLYDRKADDMTSVINN